jgi:rubredoxin
MGKLHRPGRAVQKGAEKWEEIRDPWVCKESEFRKGKKMRNYSGTTI